MISPWYAASTTQPGNAFLAIPSNAIESMTLSFSLITDLAGLLLPCTIPSPNLNLQTDTGNRPTETIFPSTKSAAACWVIASSW